MAESASESRNLHPKFHNFMEWRPGPDPHCERWRSVFASTHITACAEANAADDGTETCDAVGRPVFTARRSYASPVLGVVILSVRPSVRPSVCPSVCLSHACFVTNPKNLPAIFFYTTWQLLLVFWCQRSWRNSNGVSPTGAPN